MTDLQALLIAIAMMTTSPAIAPRLLGLFLLYWYSDLFFL